MTNANLTTLKVEVALDTPGREASASALLETIRWVGTAVRLRVDSIDLLRGLVMVLMALDHTRDFFSGGDFNPRDVHNPALFLTRWVTHFCAPVFVFLAGASAFLYGSRGRTTGEVSRYLLTRGLWLVLLELTLMRFAWTFSVIPDRLVFQVIWVLGAAMIVLSGLVFLPRWAIATFGLTLIVGHNLLDSIKSEQLGAAGWIWNFLHQPALLHPTPKVAIFVLYPLIPWIGVMAAGYALAPIMLLDPLRRRRILLVTGAVVTLGFIVLRAINLYGDPVPWAIQDGVIATVLSFINNEKYPPSLFYLAMTLGPALLALAAFEAAKGKMAGILVTFGRVPLAYYFAHLVLIHSAAVVVALATYGFDVLQAKPQGYGFGLPVVYMVWLMVTAALYPLCRWFARVKQRRSAWWLSYL
jgi:uncharacterized membrane protein